MSFSEDRIARCNITLQNETESEDTSQQASWNEQISDTCNAERTASKETSEIHDDWSKVDAEVPAGVTDTMLTATDFQVMMNDNKFTTLPLGKEVYL